ncbi:MAG: FlgD immunoglobulin-like domain containing protein [Alphaproteobacteria bacterium]|nr:FlgD immunoglobulin-like domain containing protein [Alphaproteobacteria bacterium]
MPGPNNLTSVAPKISNAESIKLQKKTMMEQKEQLKKQEKDSFEFVIASMKYSNPLDGKAMKPEKIMDFALATQNAAALMRRQEMEFSLFEMSMQNNATNTISLVGRSVRVEGDKVAFEDKPVHFAYEVPKGDLKECTIMILNSNNDPVVTLKGELKEGMHRFEWDGLDKNKQKVAKGEYSLLINGSNKPSELHALKTFVYAPIQEVEPRDGETFMYVKMLGKGIQKLPFEGDGSMSFISDTSNNTIAIAA